MANEDKTFSRLIPVTMAVLALAVLWFYWPVLAKLFGDLAENEDYSFGLLLPLVSGYIIYLKLPQIRSYLWRPSWLGLLFIAVGFALYIVGELGADLYVPRVSFVIVITGLLFLMGGWGLVRLLLFPLFLLILMFPLPGLLTKQLTMPLQLISSRLATAMLQMVGIPAFCQGNVIDLGVRQMQMVEACSGLRYILALFALGVIFCYFFQRRLWKILLLLMVLIPSAIVANAFRVMAMGIIPALQVPGFWHAFSGWLIFVFCLGILSLINWILNKIQPLSAIPPDPFAPPDPRPKAGPGDRVLPGPRRGPGRPGRAHCHPGGPGSGRGVGSEFRPLPHGTGPLAWTVGLHRPGNGQGHQIRCPPQRRIQPSRATPGLLMDRLLRDSEKGRRVCSLAQTLSYRRRLDPIKHRHRADRPGYAG